MPESCKGASEETEAFCSGIEAGFVGCWGVVRVLAVDLKENLDFGLAVERSLDNDSSSAVIRYCTLDFESEIEKRSTHLLAESLVICWKNSSSDCLGHR